MIQSRLQSHISPRGRRGQATAINRQTRRYGKAAVRLFSARSKVIFFKGSGLIFAALRDELYYDGTINSLAHVGDQTIGNFSDEM